MDDQQKKFLDHWMEYHEICQRQRLGWKPTQIAEFLGLDWILRSMLTPLNR